MPSLPFQDPLLRFIPLKARVIITGRHWIWATTWNEQNMNMDITVGIEAEVCINEHLEALARGSEHSERHTTYYNTCPHATQGTFRLDQEDIRGGEFEVEIGPSRTVCPWCKGAEWVSISAISRKFLIPEGVDIHIGSYLSYEMKCIAMRFTSTEEY